MTNGAPLGLVRARRDHPLGRVPRLLRGAAGPERSPTRTRANAALGYTALVGVPLELPPDRFAGETDYAAALARYEAEPPVRVLFDNGAGGARAGCAGPGVRGVVRLVAARRAPTRDAWYFGADGTLVDREPADAGRSTSTATTRRAAGDEPPVRRRRLLRRRARVRLATARRRHRRSAT